MANLTTKPGYPDGVDPDDFDRMVARSLTAMRQRIDAVFLPASGALLLCEHLALGAVRLGSYDWRSFRPRACSAHPELGVSCPGCFKEHEYGEHVFAELRCGACGGDTGGHDHLRYVDVALSGAWRAGYGDAPAKMRFGACWVRVEKALFLCAACSKVLPQTGFGSVEISPSKSVAD